MHIVNRKIVLFKDVSIVALGASKIHSGWPSALTGSFFSVLPQLFPIISTHSAARNAQLYRIYEAHWIRHVHPPSSHTSSVFYNSHAYWKLLVSHWLVTVWILLIFFGTVYYVVAMTSSSLLPINVNIRIDWLASTASAVQHIMPACPCF